MIEQLRNPPPLEYTRAQLIQLARERGLRGYSRLRKSQLLQRLGASRARILDREIDARMANVPFLTPTQYTPPQATPAPKPSPSSNAVENITNVLRNNRRTKVKLIFKCYIEFLRTNEIKPADFNSNIEVNIDGTDEKDLYDTMVERVLENLATFLATESETRFHSVIKLELHTVSYKPLRGETWIPLPKELAVKTAIINMKNKDNKCFFMVCSQGIKSKGQSPRKIR